MRARLEHSLVYFDLIVQCRSDGQIFHNASGVFRSCMNSLQPRAIKLIPLEETKAKVGNEKKCDIQDKGFSNEEVMHKMSSKKGSLLSEEIVT